MRITKSLAKSKKSTLNRKMNERLNGWRKKETKRKKKENVKWKTLSNGKNTHSESM